MAKGQRIGGRKKGTPNKRTAEFHAELRESGMRPLEYMLAVMRSEESTAEQKQWAAAHAAPFCHPRLAPLDRAINIALPPTDTVEDIGKAISVITASVGAGTLTTTEGKNLAAFLETRLRAIEAIELERRIAALEAKT